MKETERITKLFEDLYDGSPWIDSTLKGTLEPVTAEQAMKKISLERNSIWEIVNHIISWREMVLLRLQEMEAAMPDNNFFKPVSDTSETAWRKTLEQLQESQIEWLSFLNTMDEEDLLKINPKSNMTYFYHIHGIIQHDAYHLGQIVLLSKIIQQPPLPTVN